MTQLPRLDQSDVRADGSVTDLGPEAEAFGRCWAVVVSWIDYRFVEPLRRFLATHQLTGIVDLIAWPGGAAALATPDRETLLEAIGLACSLHDPAEIVLVAHHDCGRLGGSAYFAGRHAEITALDTALAMAGETVADRFPTRRVRLVRLDLDGQPVVVNVSGRDPVDAAAGDRS